MGKRCHFETYVPHAVRVAVQRMPDGLGRCVSGLLQVIDACVVIAKGSENGPLSQAVNELGKMATRLR